MRIIISILSSVLLVSCDQSTTPPSSPSERYALHTSCVPSNAIPLREEMISLNADDGIYDITGFAVGDGPDPGEFYLLSKRVAEAGTQDQFNAMLKDPCPAVRAMGLVCLAKHNHAFDVLETDNTFIAVFPLGCGRETMTITEFSRRLKNDDKFRVCFTETEENAWEYYNNNPNNH